MSKTRRTPDGTAYLEALQFDWTAPWAVLPSTLNAIAHQVRSEIAHPRAADRLAFAPSADSTITAGAIAVLSLTGVITPKGSWLSMLFGGSAGGLEGFQESFDEAIDDDDITTIVINVDSPGGSCALVQETGEMIREARGRKPIVACVNTMAASAAYWIASQADELVLTPSGCVGSIGVYIAHEDWSGFNEQMGVVPTYISAGKYKTEGNQDQPLSDDARAAFQQIVDDQYDLFVSAVALGRNVSEQTVRDGYGQGRVVYGARALEAGMVDRLETFDETIDRLLGQRDSTDTGTTAQAVSRAVRAASVAAQPAAAADAAGRLQPKAATDADPDPELEPDDKPDDEPVTPSAAPDADEASPDSEAATAIPSWLLFPTPRHR